MDQARFEQLKKKRFEEGLSDDEANELGQMFAEAEGENYESASEYKAEAEAAAEATATAGEAPPDESRGTEDRPQTMKEDAESRQPPDADAPAGARAPIGATEESVDEER